jgi:membrane protein DedA with SNARE-associated domain
LWVSTFLTLGYYIGQDWKEIAEAVHRYLLYGSIVLVAAAGGYYLWRRAASRR